MYIGQQVQQDIGGSSGLLVYIYMEGRIDKR